MRRRRRGFLALGAAVGLALAALAVPGTTSGFTAGIQNKVNTGASTAFAKCTDYFTYYNAAATSYFEYPLMDAVGSTTAADSSANAATATYQGTRAVDSGTPIACPKDTGSSWSLDGSSNYLYAPGSIASPGPQTFTLAIWFKTSTAGGKLIGYGSSATGSSGSYDRQIYINTAGNVVFGVYDGSTRTVQSTGTYTDGAWHQAVATFSTTAGICLYMDGTTSPVCNTSYKTAQSFTGYWRVGYDNINGWPSAPAAANYYFKGSLRFAAAYKTVLSTGEIQWQYYAGKPA